MRAAGVRRSSVFFAAVIAAGLICLAVRPSAQNRGQGSRVPGGSVSGPDSAPPPPPPSGAVRVGGEIRPPTKTQDVRPVYPPIAQAARVQGVVILETTIGPDGTVRDARVLRSIPMLDQAAVDAVKQWQFAPTMLNGAPVPVMMTVTVNFTLDDPEVPARPCAEEASMKSPAPTTTQRFIQFVNASATPRKVYWLDAAGERKLYQTVASGATYRQDTFAGHVWVVTDERDVCTAVYLATTGGQATLR